MNNHDGASGTHTARPARGLLCAALALVLIASASVGSALTLDGSSRSYLLTNQAISGDRLVPGYEYLDLAIGELGNDQFSAHFGGWGRYDFKQETGRTDLQYAYLSYARRTDNTVVNLGRVMVFEGVAAERVDGISARTDLAANFAVSAFGGIPAETNIDTPGNNLIYGGRISHQVPGLYRIGISTVHEEKNSARFRQEEGADVWLRPIDKVELLGRSTYDSVEDTWMEHNYSLVLGPFARLRFITDAWRYDYGALFRTASTPALNFTGGVLSPDEVGSSAGEEVSFAATDTISVMANFRMYEYRIMGNAKSYGGRVTYAHGMDGAAGFAIMRMSGEDDPRLRYTSYRVYGSRRFGSLDASVDLIDVHYDEAVSGVDNSYSASLALGYDLTRSLHAGADLEYLTSPTVDRDLRFLAKIEYRFGSKRGGGV